MSSGESAVNVRSSASDQGLVTGKLVVAIDANTIETCELTPDDVGGDSSGVKKYVALLTQSGTDAPVATVLENTLDGTLVWTHTGDGVYAGTLSGAFISGKTFLFIGGNTLGETSATATIVRQSANVIEVQTLSASIPVDEELLNTPIEIRVYP